MSENRCVCCGNIIPDGSMVCYACETNTFRPIKNKLIRISESDDFIVDYDKNRGMYRVSVFENSHFQYEYWFDDYKGEIKDYKLDIENYGFAKKHNPKSKEIYDFISELDFENGDYFCFRSGGDGDNREFLMDLLDCYFISKQSK